MTNVDFALFEEHYDYELIAVGGAHCFWQGYGFFDDLYNEVAEVKRIQLLYTLAKLHLNSLYGSLRPTRLHQKYLLFGVTRF